MSIDQFSIASAQLAGILCEAIFYGIYLVTCAFCAQSLLLTDGRWVRLHEVRWMMASIAMIFFIISTWDIAIGILHLFNAFIKAEDPTVEFNKVADWINLARALNQTLIALLGDFVLIYRCWIVYDRHWLVITPSLIVYLGAIAMAMKVVQIEVNRDTFNSLTMVTRPWFTAVYGINALQNILTTGMLVWRLWRVVRGVNRYTHHPDGFNEYRPRPLQKVMRVIAESGAVYTTAAFVTFLVSVSAGNAVYIPADITLQTAGIVFNVILVRCTGWNSRERPSRAAVAGPRTRSGLTTPTFVHIAGETSVHRERL